jgi:heme oxygenase
VTIAAGNLLKYQHLLKKMAKLGYAENSGHILDWAENHPGSAGVAWHAWRMSLI